MAELVAWQLLPLQSPGERKKRERVQALLDLMREPVLIPAEVDQAFTSWSFNPGQGMAHGIHNALSIVVRLVDRWVVLGEEEREALLDDPWAWRDFVASVPGTPFPTQRNELNYLVHPEAFGEVVSAVDRERIRTVFRGEVVGDAQSSEVVGDPDREFFEITLALQAKENGPAVYYREPLMSRWVDSDDPLVRPNPDPGPDPHPVVPLPPVDPRVDFPVVTGAMATTLHMPESWLQDTLDLIERRKQVILYGPPGTGKTYLAQALSKHVTDGTDGETVIVQFHPTYSYEDFFEASARSRTMMAAILPSPFERARSAVSPTPRPRIPRRITSWSSTRSTAATSRRSSGSSTSCSSTATARSRSCTATSRSPCRATSS